MIASAPDRLAFRIGGRRWSSAFVSAAAQSSSATAARQAVIRQHIANIDALKPYVSPLPLTDTFGRRHNYLRISLTERCNLRCFYCMPSEGVELSPKPSLLSDDEVFRLAKLFVHNGVTKIRLTGGEPTVRKGLVDLVARLNTLRAYGLKAIGMTTNGLVLHRHLPALVENGLTHVNISLDTLDPFRFEIMTRRRGHEAVMRSLEQALASGGLESVKLNVVVVKGLNDGEVPDFVEMTRDRNLSVRFIEFMPFTGNKWDKSKMVPSARLLERVNSQFPGVFKTTDEVNDTARSYRIPGFRGSFGFISSMSDHFCGTCNRLRLTADGKIKVCLFDAEEISLRDILRTGANDATLLETIRAAVGGKKEKHAGMEDIDVVTNRPMILIGDAPGVDPYPWLASRSPPPSRVSKKSRSALLPLRARGGPARVARYSTQQQRPQPSAGSGGAPTPPSRPTLTHVDHRGRPSMVDVSGKPSTSRSATARGRILLPQTAYDLIVPPPPALPDAVAPGSETEPDTAARTLERARARAKDRARAKGDVLAVAQLAAIMACKRTSELIPLCHPLPLTHVAVTLTPEVRDAGDGDGDGSGGGGGDRKDDDDEYDAAAAATVATGTGNTNRARASGGRKEYGVICTATVRCSGQTGVEMEALTAVSVGLLTVWDMLKAVAGKEMVITDVIVVHKSGGKSGDFERAG